MTAAKYLDELAIVDAVDDANTGDRVVNGTDLNVAVARVLIEQASDIAEGGLGGGGEVEGTGVAGTPAGGVLSVQGVAGGTALPISGTVAVSGTVPVSDGGGSLTVDGTVAVSGTVATTNTEVPASTGAATAVALTTTSATLKAANASRIGLIIYNPLSVTVYVRLENADAAAVQSFWVLPGETYEMPRRYYTGIITAATASSSGNAFVTELV